MQLSPAVPHASTQALLPSEKIAWQLLPAVRSQSVPGPFRGAEVQGVTGTLQADSMGRIHRRLLWATLRDGQPAPAVLPTGEFQPVSGER